MTETLEQELAKWFRHRDVKLGYAGFTGVCNLQIDVSISREEKYIETLKEKAEDGCIEAIMALMKIAAPRAHDTRPTGKQLKDLLDKLMKKYEVIRAGCDRFQFNVPYGAEVERNFKLDELRKLIADLGLEYGNDCLYEKEGE